jgi:hypothetical protein
MLVPTPAGTVTVAVTGWLGAFREDRVDGPNERAEAIPDRAMVTKVREASRATTITVMTLRVFTLERV